MVIEEDKWADTAIYCAKMAAFWLFWLLFYIVCGFELTFVCLVVKIAWNTRKK